MLTGFAGCSSSQHVQIGKAQTTKERSDALPVDYVNYAKLGYRLDWKGYPTITGSLPIRLLSISSDAIGVIEQGSNLTILEPGTGGQRCAIQLANPLSHFVGLGRQGARIVAASEADIFTLDPATCTLVGRQSFYKIVATNPLMVNNALIAGTTDGELFAQLNTPGINGAKLWGFAVPGAINHNPVMVGDSIGAVSQSGAVFFVTPDKGDLLGRAKVFGGMDTNPVSNGRLMFIASLDQSLYAFAPRGAQQVWRYRTSAPLRVQPTAFKDRVYCAIPELGLTAFDANTGKVLWSIKDFSGVIVASNKGGLLGFDGTSGVLINPSRGDVIERIKLPGVASLQTDTFENGNLYAISTSGVVAKFVSK
jgi:outer membrane protein assembly factor BamB